MELLSVQSAIEIQKGELLIQWAYGKISPEMGASELHFLEHE